MGDAAKIHPVLVVLALLVGEHYYGLTGALFAVPIASIVLTLFKFLQQHALHLQEQEQEQAETAPPTPAAAAPEATAAATPPPA
jgi:predicted PurR-regulated permease PerM